MPRLDPGRQRSMMPTVPLEIHELFPDEDYRFHLTLRKGDLGAFFSPANPAVLEERRRWLNDDSETVLAQSEGCQPLVREMEANGFQLAAEHTFLEYQYFLIFTVK